MYKKICIKIESLVDRKVRKHRKTDRCRNRKINKEVGQLISVADLH